jgi:hypothetical protein
MTIKKIMTRKKRFDIIFMIKNPVCVFSHSFDIHFLTHLDGVYTNVR